MNDEWIISSHSNPNGECVKARRRRRKGTVQVGDSKLPDTAPVLEFTPQAWRVFTTRLKAIPSDGR